MSESLSTKKITKDNYKTGSSSLQVIHSFQDIAS